MLVIDVTNSKLLQRCLLLQCCAGGGLLSPDIEDPGDRVEVAFRRLDMDGDGFIDEDDFMEVLIDRVTYDNIVS